MVTDLLPLGTSTKHECSFVRYATQISTGDVIAKCNCSNYHPINHHDEMDASTIIPFDDVRDPAKPEKKNS